MQDALGAPMEQCDASSVRLAGRDHVGGAAVDPEALARALPQHQQPLYGLCRGTLNSAQDAEDAVQETMLRALRALPTFRGECSLRTWLCRIAVSVCLDRIKALRRAAALFRAAGQAAAPPPSAQAAAVCRLEVLEALRSVPPQRRAVLLLRELEGWTVAEIAETMGCKTKKVENELYQARRALATWARHESEG